MTDDDFAYQNKNSTAIFDGFITEEEYARQRGVSVRTCQRDRALRKAPPHLIIGKQIHYRVESVRKWFDKQERRFEALGPTGSLSELPRDSKRSAQL